MPLALIFSTYCIHYWSHFYVGKARFLVDGLYNKLICFEAKYHVAQLFWVLAKDQIKVADKEHLENGHAAADDKQDINCRPG